MAPRAPRASAGLRSVRAAGAIVAAAAVASCSSSSPPSSSPLPSDAAAVCPATLGLTVGQRCAPDGLRCAPEYACGVTNVTLLCACTRGTFECTDGRGNVLAADETPVCPASPAEAGACPATETAAQFAPCSEQGLLCAYPSGCPSAFDSCLCFAGRTKAGLFGLRFECTPRTCDSRDAAVPADLGDGTTPTDSATDAATPGSRDAAAATDAGPTSDADLPRDSGPRSETGVLDGASD